MSIPQSGGGPIEHHDQLAEYLSDGCKPKEDWRIGTEHEKFGYCKDTLQPCHTRANAPFWRCWKVCAMGTVGPRWKKAAS